MQSTTVAALALAVFSAAVVAAAPSFYPSSVCTGSRLHNMPHDKPLKGLTAPYIGVWVKHDRSSAEVRHINITQSPSDPNEIMGFYLDSELAGRNTWNVTLCGDGLSGTGFYNNFNSDLSQACPTPFGLILTADPNVINVAYGRAPATQPCGEYDGDSATYYRQAC